MSMATLGEMIRARREELGPTQEQVAERLGEGVRQSEISRLEHDHISLPRRPRLEQLARALELPMGELLLRSGWAGAEELPGPELQDRVDALTAVNADLRQ
jgi:transcriptional regulator with XRE-family HTH domain